MLAVVFYLIFYPEKHIEKTVVFAVGNEIEAYRMDIVYIKVDVANATADALAASCMAKTCVLKMVGLLLD